MAYGQERKTEAEVAGYKQSRLDSEGIVERM